MARIDSILNSMPWWCVLLVSGEKSEKDQIVICFFWWLTGLYWFGWGKLHAVPSKFFMTG